MVVVVVVGQSQHQGGAATSHWYQSGTAVHPGAASQVLVSFSPNNRETSGNDATSQFRINKVQSN